MDIGFLWGQWVGLLGRLQGNQVQASSKFLTVSFLAAFTPFTPWGCLFFYGQNHRGYPGVAWQKEHQQAAFCLGKYPSETTISTRWNPPGIWWAGQPDSGKTGHPRGWRASCLCAEEPAAFARAFQASKVFGDFNGEVIGISRTLPSKILMS